MNTDIYFMNELFRIINGALRLDIDKVRNYTAFLADKLESAGDKSSANLLRKMLQENDRQLRPAGSSFTKILPIDSESRFPLLERVNTKENQEPPIILPQEQWDVVNEFLSVAKSHAQFEAQGVPSSLSFLISGPPGTGKSRLARYIAKELGVDLYIARLDGLISSFLGNTSKNIRALFDFAAKTPCVLFLDEFDAIAKLRGDNQELGELKRVVNSFIQNLDMLGAQSTVIAATNHEELLDSAIWRRFSYRLSFALPSTELRQKMWKQFISPLNFEDKTIDLLVDLSEGFSGSDIQEVSLRLQRWKIINQTTPLLKDAFKVLQNIAIGEERRFLSKLKGKDPLGISTALHNRNPALYNSSAIAQLIGISKATAYRWGTKGVKPNGRSK